jgi:hypothetical protein
MSVFSSDQEPMLGFPGTLLIPIIIGRGSNPYAKDGPEPHFYEELRFNPDPAGKADGHCMWNVTNERPAPQQTNQRENEAGEENGDQEPVQGDGTRHKSDEWPAGPPIWQRLPPSADTKKPPTTAAYNPRSGETPEARAIAIDSGWATIATVSAANISKQPRL